MIGILMLPTPMTQVAKSIGSSTTSSPPLPPGLAVHLRRPRAETEKARAHYPSAQNHVYTYRNLRADRDPLHLSSVLALAREVVVRARAGARAGCSSSGSRATGVKGEWAEGGGEYEDLEGERGARRRRRGGTGTGTGWGRVGEGGGRREEGGGRREEGGGRREEGGGRREEGGGRREEGGGRREEGGGRREEGGGRREEGGGRREEGGGRREEGGGREGKRLCDAIEKMDDLDNQGPRRTLFHYLAPGVIDIHIHPSRLLAPPKMFLVSLHAMPANVGPAIQSNAPLVHYARCEFGTSCVSFQAAPAFTYLPPSLDARRILAHCAARRANGRDAERDEERGGESFRACDTAKEMDERTRSSALPPHTLRASSFPNPGFAADAPTRCGTAAMPFPPDYIAGS
ncbi:hypothetical protein K438DRAFT_1788577 [Mycena galopus ATCC 62051]|nr:hypothetical protein K438DRAFT_1788577 [Mycena galopus ATCC 62051]